MATRPGTGRPRPRSKGARSGTARASIWSWLGVIQYLPLEAVQSTLRAPTGTGSIPASSRSCSRRPSMTRRPMRTTRWRPTTDAFKARLRPMRGLKTDSYLPNEAVEVIRHHTEAIRPGGVVLMMDFDVGASRAEPPVPLVMETLSRILAAFRHAGCRSRAGDTPEPDSGRRRPAGRSVGGGPGLRGGPRNPSDHASWPALPEHSVSQNPSHGGRDRRSHLDTDRYRSAARLG